MTHTELAESMKQVSDLVHRIYQEANDGPRLLNELFREYPKTRQLRRAVTDRYGAAGELSGIPAIYSIR